MPLDVEAAATLVADDDGLLETDDTEENSAARATRTDPPAVETGETRAEAPLSEAPLSETARSEAPRSTALAGRLIAERYRLVARLGEGAHGEVWVADDLV